MKKIILLFLQGILIGTGAILPGVSGGVLCIAFGIYEPMMEILAHPFKSIKKYYKMFIPLVIGAVVGFVLLAKLVEWLLTVSETATLMLFVGLICGTIPGLFRKAVEIKPNRGWGTFVVILVFSYVVFNILQSGFTGTIEPNFWWFIFCGVIWGLSMIVPGLSSSSVLLFMGLYQPMADGIGSLDFRVIIPLMIGFLATVFTLSKVVNFLLKKYPTAFSRVILGFVVASTLMITPVDFSSIWQFVLGAACFVAGFATATLMDRLQIEDTGKNSAPVSE